MITSTQTTAADTAPAPGMRFAVVDRWPKATLKLRICLIITLLLALLTVANTGAVVAAGELERLFEPFARLPRDRITTADGHHGLGLSIVRAIATAHGATVSARAQPGGGLEVTVAFPSRDGTAVQALASGVKE